MPSTGPRMVPPQGIHTTTRQQEHPPPIHQPRLPQTLQSLEQGSPNMKTHRQPRSIHKNGTYQASLIIPTDHIEDAHGDMRTIFTRTGNELKLEVQQHFIARLEANRNITQLNPTDEMAKTEVVLKQITSTIGLKLSETAPRALITGRTSGWWKIKVNRQGIRLSAPAFRRHHQ